MATSKYKVGDKVRVIKNYDKLQGTYVGYVGKMKDYMGQLITISRVASNGKTYQAKETDELFWWGNDCFEDFPNAMCCYSLL